MSCGSEPSFYCSTIASTQLKLYQAFIFSVPVFLIILFLLLFYVFFLRRQRERRHSMRMTDMEEENPPPGILSSELGIKKEVREMLPVVVFKESDRPKVREQLNQSNTDQAQARMGPGSGGGLRNKSVREKHQPRWLQDFTN